jgi:folate-binding protein YgfZ
MLHGQLLLDDCAVLRASGADAASFLHSQLTADIAGLDGGQAQLAGYCSAKGRLLASFVVLRPAPDELLLLCDRSVAASTLKRLSMFVLRARCKLADASAEWRLHGLAGLDPAAFGLPAPGAAWRCAHEDGCWLIRLPDAAGVRRHWLLESAARPSRIAPDAAALTAAQWQWLWVQSGVPVITAATAEQFVPQMVNFEAVGGVNFKKGCYPGQEVVARSQYRGTLKRRMFLVHGDEPLAAGDEIYHATDPTQPAGMIVLAAPSPQGGVDALAELKLAATQGASLHAKSPDGPVLALGTLPYALPVEA